MGSSVEHWTDVWGRHVEDWAHALGRLVFPPRCALCGAAGAHDRDLCAACLADLPFNRNACPRCALPLSTPAPLCAGCARRPPPYAAALAPFRYAYPLDQLVMRYKFGGELAVGRVLAGLVVDAVRGAADTTPALGAIDMVVPVPLHRDRLAERGFNQALEIARPLARRLAWPLRYDVLVRERATPPQTGLDAATRRRNLRHAFAVRADVAGRRIALVDDVVTTGATTRECARALKRAGAVEVFVIAIARAA